MRLDHLVLAAAGTAVLLIATTASADDRRRVSPVSPEEVVGAWTGAATWRGCPSPGRREVVVTVGWASGAFVDGSALMAGWPTVPLTSTAGQLTGVDQDLTVTLSVTRFGRATLVLAAATGCTGVIQLRRATSSIDACDAWAGLARVQAGCTTRAGASADKLARSLTRRLADWKRLGGKARTRQAEHCRREADVLRPALVDASCLDGAGTSGSPACDRFLTTLDHFVACPKVSDEVIRAVREAADLSRHSWVVLQDPSVPAVAKAAVIDTCTQGEVALKRSGEALGCEMP